MGFVLRTYRTNPCAATGTEAHFGKPQSHWINSDVDSALSINTRNSIPLTAQKFVAALAEESIFTSRPRVLSALAALNLFHILFAGHEFIGTLPSPIAVVKVLFDHSWLA